MPKNVYDCLKERGFIDQITDEALFKKTLEKPTKLYLGFDPTAASLHVGHLMGLIVLCWFQKFGHPVYALVGGATGRIGDPSGKSIERPFLSEKNIDENVKALEKFLEKIFPEKVELLNNNTWFSHMGFIEFLRDVGKHFRISTMLGKESVRARLESSEGMSFTEFSYQILQAYDFYYLYHHYGIALQIGGSDQWGNITAGTELARKLGDHALLGLTFPLLTRSDGKKFGKSEEGAIWLSSEFLSPYEFYQYFLKIPDTDVVRMLRLLTFMPIKEIEELKESMSSPDYVPNTLQKILAGKVTLFVHGEEGVQAALSATKAAFSKDSFEDLKDLKAAFKDLPHVSYKKEEILEKKFTELALKAGLVSSKAEAARLIQNQGAYINNQRIDDLNYVITSRDLLEGTYILIAKGKKKKIWIQLVK